MPVADDAAESTRARSDERATLPDIFARACVKFADEIALDIPPTTTRARVRLTYRELDALSRAVAQLVAELVEPITATDGASDKIVALALSRTDARLYAAMLGAMRAGCAYCAIDPAFPAQQASEILRDSKAIALVCDTARAESIAASGTYAPVITPRDIDAAHARGRRFIDRDIDQRSLAYVIYTSGTTGAPKGVEIEHASIANLVTSDIHEFQLTHTDRVVQGSSASYDSSVEELWLAWAVGATVVVMDDEASRLGPDLLSWLQRESVTVLCPPPTLLRTLGSADPLRDLPKIHLLYVGGEALPVDLANAWSRGRRLENGYGPTECTVTCVRATVHENEPVTIGRAVANTFAWVIDPEHLSLREITDHSHGELVIGGASLARGYRNQPETTAARFVEHATLGRIYRTGDLVHCDASGDFHYHGRIDAQVKIRGYRIELGAIEAKLVAHPSIREAACTIEGEGSSKRIVAHVVANIDASVDALELRNFLSAQLPTYMVPALIVEIAAIPRSVGGKIDRKQLPATTQVVNADIEYTAADTPTERIMADAFAHALGRSDALSVTADLFDELALDSLTIAIAISRMRTDARTIAATVRLAYEHRTIRDASRVLDARVPTIERIATIRAPTTGVSRPFCATAIQAAFIIALLCTASQLLWIPDAGTLLGATIESSVLGTFTLVLTGLCALSGYAIITILAGVTAKWLLIGRYTPARVRAWSMWHMRHWIVVRLVSMAPWELFEALGIAPIALRALGARIGKHVHIHRGVRLTDGGWDLITLDDFATIGQDASLRAVDLEAGTLVIGPVRVRRGATLETRAALGPGADLGEGSILRALSYLPAGERHDFAVLDGTPATRVAHAPQPPSVDPPLPSMLVLLFAAVLFASIVTAILLPWMLACRLFGIDADTITHVLFANEQSWLPSASGIALLCATIACAGVGTVVMEALLVRALGRAPTRPFDLRSATAIRLSFQSALVEAAGKWLSGTLMWPMWLNLAGAKIGRGCEISTITDVIPSTVTIGRETFFADGVYLGGPRLHATTASIEPVVLGESCFIGNHAVLPAGTRLAPETLVGISTRGDGLPFETGQSWFGHPLFRLPRREIVEAPREFTHEPSLVRRCNRWAWELARFVLPIGPFALGLVWFRAMESAEASLSPLAFRSVVLPASLLAVCLVLVTAVLMLKWLLVGRVKPGTHPLWSCWCSRWDFLYVAWGMWASVPLAFTEGTLLLVGYLRLMGCRIGKRALLGPSFSHVVDPDMLHFGDDVTVQALFQAHTFEDRVLKIDHVHIRDGATVGANTVMLYGADVGAHTIVLPHSVVMKREVLLPNTVYAGVPTQAVGVTRA